ncbi:ribose transport system ATP-binding protein [Thermanaeromonas toyohensis ToBE]|uniref:Ribose transport system ATP-binding protein n=1 Tax=Thermanaeromonas toyohensis ToBE TaxID=698762 RepID=A0A1W1VJB7_9FIRM|nr:sugar ABC transporter ATP-binding protein [Thermanaeromonas toyohensis]SMB93469.1 ribose transport system ATP-binding protein [Thermanaeromonas toyohensis ToBE]
MPEVILKVEDVSKSFPGVRALEKVSLVVERGEIHALVGENGAGKSTLIKILSGIYQPDEGRIWLEGKEIALKDPRQAQNLGIVTIHQEFNLVPHLTVAENIFLGHEQTRTFLGFIHWQELRSRATTLLDQLGVKINPTRLVQHLSVAEQQMVEIAKALSLQARILIMDEPTATLTGEESTKLFNIIRAIKEKGVSIIYVSHRLEEIFAICDRITILRDGKWIATRDIKDVTPEEVIKLMVGRDIKERFPRRLAPKFSGQVALEVKGLNRKGKLHDINLRVRYGEILGIAGLVGAGRTELARAIMGLYPKDSGEIFLDGRKVNISFPWEAIRLGLAYVPEDRKGQGLLLNSSIKENISLTQLDHISRWGFIDRKAEIKACEEAMVKFRIKGRDCRQKVKNLSGGNQQKVVLAKWLASRPKVLILDEPTRGIDVGAKAEIYELIQALAAEGVAIIMISSDLPEILGMSDRIIVVHEGRVVGEFLRGEVTEEKIMGCAVGGKLI